MSTAMAMKKRGLLFLFLLMLGLGFAGLKVWQLFKNIRASQLDLGDTLNILLVSKEHDALFVSFRGEDDEVTLFTVEADDVQPLLSSTEESGWQPAEYAWNLGILPDVAIELNELDLDATKQNPKQYLLSLFAPRSQSLEQALPFWVRLQLWRYMWGIDSSRFTLESLKNFIVQNPDKDGHIQTLIDRDELSTFVQKRFSSSQLKRASVELSILNASERSGLGGVLSELLNNYGYHIIKVDNAPTQESSELIRTNIQMELQRTEQHSRFLFGNNELSISDTPQNFQEFRSDFTIIIGKNQSRVQLIQ